MQHLDEGTIHAWLDGALPPADARAVEAHLAECDACATDVADARGLVAASSRILAALDDVPAGVIPTARDDRPRPAAGGGASDRAGRAPSAAGAPRERDARGRARRRWIPAYARTAAAVVLATAGAAALLRVQRDGAAGREAARATVAMDGPGAAPAAAPVTLPATRHALRPRVAPPAATPRASDGAVKRRAGALVVHGQVRSDAGAPLRSVPIAVAGTAFGTLTDTAGHYAIALPSSFAGRAVTLLTRRAGSEPQRDTVSLAASSAARDVVVRAGAPVLSKTVVSAAGEGRGAPAPAPRDSAERPRLMKSETLRGPDGMTVRQFYAVRPGVVVMLDATTPSPDEAPPGAVDSQRAEPLADSAAGRGANTIEWAGPGGMRYALSGPLPVAELERVKTEIAW